MVRPGDIEVERVDRFNELHRNQFEQLLASSPDLLSEHKALSLGNSNLGYQLAVRENGIWTAAAVVVAHGDVWNVELVQVPGHELASMLAFDAAMVELDGVSVRLWEPTGGLHAQLHEAMGRYDITHTRTLLHLERSLIDVPPQDLAVSSRTIDLGRDSTSWVAANNEAFADHPEQGLWTEATLRERSGQQWFDAELFFLHGEVGYEAWCWCKVEEKVQPGRGEIYVIGTRPSAQGKGLGRKMLELGCHAMSLRGVQLVDLYVEADNVAARTLYERAGFSEAGILRSWTFS